MGPNLIGGELKILMKQESQLNDSVCRCPSAACLVFTIDPVQTDSLIQKIISLGLLSRPSVVVHNLSPYHLKVGSDIAGLTIVPGRIEVAIMEDVSRRVVWCAQEIQGVISASLGAYTYQAIGFNFEYFISDSEVNKSAEDWSRTLLSTRMDSVVDAMGGLSEVIVCLFGKFNSIPTRVEIGLKAPHEVPLNLWPEGAGSKCLHVNVNYHCTCDAGNLLESIKAALGEVSDFCNNSNCLARNVVEM